MQEKNESRSNKMRTEQTKSALKTAARKLFVKQGFNATGTEEIVKTANVTRGALYHHYGDKRELFEDIIKDECRAVAQQIENDSLNAGNKIAALKQGADAFIFAMASKGRTKLILIEAPTILGRNNLIALEKFFARKQLKAGIHEAMQAGHITKLPLEPLVDILSSVFDSAALSLDAGMEKDSVLEVVHAVLDGLCVK